MKLDLTEEEANILRVVVRHAEKHQSTVFYDMDTQWPQLVSLREKMKAADQEPKASTE